MQRNHSSSSSNVTSSIDYDDTRIGSFINDNDGGISNSSTTITTDTHNSDVLHSSDTLGRLPIEILGLILEQLTNHDIVECMSVSASWRNRLACCSAPWREIIMTQKEQIHAISPWITTVHHFVKDITFSCETPLIFTKAMSWITDGYFPHLCSLQIYKCTEDDVEPLVGALQKMGCRLRKLLVEFMVELIPYQDVMRMCPNLTELCYYTALDNPSSDALTIPANPLLMHLELHVRELFLPDLEHVLQAYPNIRYLSVQRCDKVALQMIHQHCPKLEFLSFNAAPYLLPWMRLLGKETATSIGLSRDIRSCRRLGIKTAELLASEFLDHFPHGMAKWTPTLNVGRLQAYRRAYDRDMHPKIIAAVFPSDDHTTIAEISAQFLSKALLWY